MFINKVVLHEKEVFLTFNYPAKGMVSKTPAGWAARPGITAPGRLGAPWPPGGQVE